MVGNVFTKPRSDYSNARLEATDVVGYTFFYFRGLGWSGDRSIIILYTQLTVGLGAHFDNFFQCLSFLS